MNEKSNQDTKPLAFIDLKILLIEDMPVNQRVMELLFLKQGLKIDLASSGLEAIQKIEVQEYDLIFMDCHMPIMDGYMTTIEIRKKFTKKTPIIALTASAMSGDREKCLEAGMDDYLPKPISKESLVACLQKWILNMPIVSWSNKRKKDLSHSIDWSIFERLVELDPENQSGFLSEMLELFKKNVPQHLRLISEALAVGNSEKVKKEAHALKSATCYLGAVGIARLCNEAESSAIEAKFARVAEILLELNTEYLRVIQILS